ncbi:MAG: hypothetical protein AMXMBFR4_28320 [Candidatus Hydrogenedentota bacterium]
MGQRVGFSEKRRFRRVAIDRTIRMVFAGGTRGTARIRDVDQGGMRIETTVAPRCGQHILIEFDEPCGSGKVAELKGRVAWSQTTQGGFEVGIRIYEDEYDVHVILCALVCAGLKKAAAIAQLRDRHFLYVEWKLASLAATEAAAADRDQRKPLRGRGAVVGMAAARA